MTCPEHSTQEEWDVLGAEPIPKKKKKIIKKKPRPSPTVNAKQIHDTDRRRPHRIEHGDPRVTVTAKEDRREYNRQTSYIYGNPNCVSIPPRKRKIAPAPTTKSDPRVTADWTTDTLEFTRQRRWVRDNPDNTGPIPAWKPRPARSLLRKKHKDPRVTVIRADDVIEYQRQVVYINKYPDCVSVPPRKERHVYRKKI